MNSPQLLTEREAAAALRISRNTVRKILPKVRLSERGTRYDARDIERLIAASKEAK